MRNIIPSFIILFFFLQGCAVNSATGRKELILISTDGEVTLGQEFHAQVLSQYKLSQDEAKVSRLRRIGEKIAQVSDRQDYEYQFFLVQSDELNAFTIPGGRVYFFSGLFDKLKTDDQIASVLAHEIGHCAAKHTIKKFQGSLGYNLISSIAFSRLGGGAKQAASLGANTVMGLAMSAYGRRDEYEADSLGLKYMYLAGYDLNGMIESFQVLESESKGAHPPLILSTHPFIEDRIEAVKKQIPEIKEKY